MGSSDDEGSPFEEDDFVNEPEKPLKIYRNISVRLRRNHVY